MVGVEESIVKEEGQSSQNGKNYEMEGKERREEGGKQSGEADGSIGACNVGTCGTAVAHRKQWGPQDWSLGCTYTLRSHKTHVL